MKQENECTYEGKSELFKCVNPNDLPAFLHEHVQSFLASQKLFAAYMRTKFKEKHILQQNVFLAADISENYGYKLIAEEKHTSNRDVILRICLAAHFTLNEVQEALILYGMSPLYWRITRDFVILVAIYNRIYDIQQVNELLRNCNQNPMIEDMW